MSHKARPRPPRLAAREPVVHVAPPASAEERLERAKVAGTAAAPGRTELRRHLERVVAGDRLALGELTRIQGLTMVESWAALNAVYGATYELPTIDPARTLAFVGRAVQRIREVAHAGGRVAFATAIPASLLPLHLALARFAQAEGARVDDADDIGPIRADGRHPRWLRTFDGVVTVTDGRSLCETHDGEAAREWVFVLGRPQLVVADGPFAEVAWELGLEVVAFAGLDRWALAVPAVRGERCTVVPMRTDRPPTAYRTLLTALRPVPPEM